MDIPARLPAGDSGYCKVVYIDLIAKYLYLQPMNMGARDLDFSVDGSTSEIVRRQSLPSENLKMLDAEQLDVIRRRKWFKMFIPQQYGGLGLTLPEILKIEERLSWTDGSFGWVVTLCAGAGWFVGFVSPEIAREFFDSDDICVCGSGAAAGVADVVGSGYRINGYWKYATGSQHATAFTANCYLKLDGDQLHNPDGTPAMASFIFKKEEVMLHQTWDAMGMVATGSHSFEISNLLVPSNRRFDVKVDSAVLPGAIFRYPFLQLAETTLAVNISGMALRFAELADRMVENAPSGKRIVAEASKNLHDCRVAFYTASEESWAFLESGLQIPNDLLNRVSDTSHKLVKVARALANDLYPLCGLTAAIRNSEINRVWRNLHTAAQHSLINS